MCLSRFHKGGIGSRVTADENYYIILHIALRRIAMIKNFRATLSRVPFEY